MINGINHINVSVKNIENSFSFYKGVMGFVPLCKSEGSAYFLVGNPDDPGSLWFSLDLDRNGMRNPSQGNTHIAFSVAEHDFDVISARIIQSGVSLFKENTSPGKSLYFLDPDDHKLEIHVGNWRDRITAKKENAGNWKNVEWFI